MKTETIVQLGTFACQVVVSIFLARLTYRLQEQNTKIAENKLILDVYDRRLKIYFSIIEFMRYCFSASKIDQDKYSEFFKNVRESDFLFGEDIVRYTQEILNKVSEIILYEDVLAERNEYIDTNRPVPDDVKQEYEKGKKMKMDNKKWLRGESEKISRRFKAYFDLSTVSKVVESKI